MSKNNLTNKQSTISNSRPKTWTVSCKNKETMPQITWDNWPKLSQNFRLWPTRKIANKTKWQGFKNYWTRGPFPVYNSEIGKWRTCNRNFSRQFKGKRKSELRQLRSWRNMTRLKDSWRCNIGTLLEALKDKLSNSSVDWESRDNNDPNKYLT